MDKPQMIDAIIQSAKNASVLKGLPIDIGDLFFCLAFKTESELNEICMNLRIN